MKTLLIAALSSLLAISAFSQTQGVSLRSTNGVAFGTLTVQGHVDGTNTSVTNKLLGKFVTGAGNTPAGAFGIVGGVNNQSGQNGITVGAGNLVSAANALAAGRSNSIGSDAINSISAGFLNTGSGQNSYVNGESNNGGGQDGFLHGSRILVNSGIAGVDHNFLTGQRYSLQDGTSNTFVWSVGSPVLALDGSDSGAFYINASNKIVLLGAPIYGNGLGLTNIPGASITTPFVGVSGVSPYTVSNLWSVVLPDGATAFQLGNPGAGYASIFATNLIVTPDGLRYTIFTQGTNTLFGGDIYVTNGVYHGKSFRPQLVAATIVGATAQSTNLMELQDGSSNVLASVTASGVFTGNGSGLTNNYGISLVPKLGPQSAVIFEGDSLMVNLHPILTNNFPAWSNVASVQNFAVSGAVMADLLSRWTNNVAPAISNLNAAGITNITMPVAILANDLFEDTATFTATLASYSNYVTRAESSNVTVIAFTILPQKFQEDQRLLNWYSGNSYLRGFALPNYTIDWCRMLPTPDSLVQYVDGVHPTSNSNFRVCQELDSLARGPQRNKVNLEAQTEYNTNFVWANSGIILGKLTANGLTVSGTSGNLTVGVDANSRHIFTGNVGIGGAANNNSPFQVGLISDTYTAQIANSANFMGVDDGAHSQVGVWSTTAAATGKGSEIILGGRNTASGGATSPFPFAKIRGAKEGAANTYNGYLEFLTTQGDSDIQPRMHIDSAGNVGIGKTNPAAKLDVAGDVNSTAGTRTFTHNSTHTVITNTATLTGNEWTSGQEKYWFNGTNTIVVDKTNGLVKLQSLMITNSTFPSDNATTNGQTSGQIWYGGTSSNAHTFFGNLYKVNRSFVMGQSVVLTDTVVSNSATGGKTNIYTIPMAANYLTVGKVLETKLDGLVWQNNNAATLVTVQAWVDSTNLLLTVPLQAGAAITAGPVELTFMFTCRSIGSGTSASVVGRCKEVQATTSGGSATTAMDITLNPVTFDSTVNNTINITVSNTVTGGGGFASFRLQEGRTICVDSVPKLPGEL